LAAISAIIFPLLVAVVVISKVVQSFGLISDIFVHTLFSAVHIRSTSSQVNVAVSIASEKINKNLFVSEILEAVCHKAKLISA
jgi:hypothetical protein